MANHRNRDSLMFQSLLCTFLALIVTFLPVATAQDVDSSEHARKVLSRVPPNYPELAKKMKITGTVRVVAFVAPNGSVKLTQPVGGNPVLLKAAQDSIEKWKFVKGAEETKELIELHFSTEDSQ